MSLVTGCARLQNLMERTQAEEAAYRLEMAYDKAVKEAKKNATQTGGGESKYSISGNHARKCFFSFHFRKIVLY